MKHKNFKLVKTVFILLLLGSNAAYAANTAKPTQLELQEQMDSGKKAIGALNQMDAILNAQVAETEGQCMKAVGAPEFCKCISWQAPGNFIQYVAILSKTKDELNYENLPKGDKELVDNIRKAREKCVK